MRWSKKIILEEIKELEAQLASLTIELERRIEEDTERPVPPKAKSPLASDFQHGDGVKVLKPGKIPFDINKVYNVVSSTKERVEVQVDTGIITRAPKNLKKIE